MFGCNKGFDICQIVELVVMLEVLGGLFGGCGRDRGCQNGGGFDICTLLILCMVCGGNKRPC